MLIKPGGNGHGFLLCSLFSSSWQKVQSLTEKAEVTNDGGGKETEIKE